MFTSLMTAWLLAAPAQDCTPVEKEIHGTSLQGQLMPGQKVLAVPPSCVTLKRLDFVIFTSDESENLVIKQVWGMPGDVLAVDARGFVSVNGEQVLTPFDRPYRLTPYYAKQLRKHEGTLAGYLLLGHPGSLDSGRVGPIPYGDIVGVVHKEEGREREGR